MTPQEEGRQFERDLAEEFGIQNVPGSGSVWHSKLDLKGNVARWSLKFTGKEQFPISYADILEALNACYGLGGDGATPLWAVRIPAGDFIIMTKDDFKALQYGDVKIINQEKPALEQRKAKAKMPELLRDDGDN